MKLNIIQELAANSTLSHYSIVSKLGAGGMGEVYLAQDTKLDRKVALKVLSADVASNRDRTDRFVREAKSAAALNHPNIAHVYEIGESDGTHYIAMEFIDGVTLREKINHEETPLSKLLKYLTQVAEGLNKAHAAGIVHRDLKPDNIMITRDDYAKVLDFGLAKLVEPQKAFGSRTSSSEVVTAMMQQQSIAGMVLGTIGYMSPEQASGRVHEIDHRSDVFSFGCILFEAASRQKAFEGKDALDSLHKVVHAPTPLLKDVNPLAPDDLQRMVRRCLAKERDKRYQSMKEVAIELDDLQQELKRQTASDYSGRVTSSASVTTSGAESSTSIAVLPFVNISNDPDNEYFCDGLAEELLNALTKIDHLKVAARTSAFSFKGKNAAVSEIGQKLNVKTVLEGSVRRSGNRLRITVQLVNASEGYHLWSERYDREMQDIFNVQDEITLAVVDALKLKLFSDEKAVVLKRYTDDVEAHELFLKGRYYHYKYSAEGWRRAIEFFERAIEKEPNYAPAYAGMNTSLGFLWFLGFLSAEQAVPQMKAAAIKALEIDENLAEAHLSQAMISFFYDWEWQKAEQEFKRAIGLDPHNAEALSFYSMFLGFEERFKEAIDQGERAIAIDPLSTVINMNVGWTFFSAGLFDKTLDQADKMIEVEPDFYGSYWLRGAIYLSEGDYDKAVNELKKAVSLGGRQIVLADLGGAYGLAGNNDEARAILDQLLEMRQREYVPAICMARIYSRIGENEKAIDWLERALEEKNGEMVFLRSEIVGAAAGDSLNSLGSHPRLMELLRKMRLPQQTR